MALHETPDNLDGGAIIHQVDAEMGSINSKNPGHVLAVFLNNKLITCDTVVPLIMEVHAANPHLGIEFYVGDEATQEAIQKNIVLWDAIRRMGVLILWGRRAEERAKGPFFKALHGIAVMRMLFRLVVKGSMGRATFLHFRTLSHWPWRLLFLAAPKRTFLCQGAVHGYSKKEQLIDNTWRPRKHFHETPPSARGGLICFTEDWDELALPRHANTPRYWLGKFWYGTAWPAFVQENSAGYLSTLPKKTPEDSEPNFIVYLMGFFGYLDLVGNDTAFKDLLYNTLRALHEEAPDILVVLKPHPTTDIQYLNEVLSAIPGHNFVLSYLHPAVLCCRALFFVGNYPSSTMAVVHANGIPVVEYYRYQPKALKITGGNSSRPDIVDTFIQDDEEAFRAYIRKAIQCPPVKGGYSERPDQSGIVAAIAQLD